MWAESAGRARSTGRRIGGRVWASDGRRVYQVQYSTECVGVDNNVLLVPTKMHLVKE